MSPETERFRELDRLIRTAHAELGTLQLHLIAAHERQLNPAELARLPQLEAKKRITD